MEPHDYFANLLVGIDLLRTNRPADSIAYLQEAAHQRPEEDFPYEYLGEAQAHLRHYPEAATAYERALAVAPASSQAIEAAVGSWLERFRELAAQLRASTRGLAAEHRLQARSHAFEDAEKPLPLEHSVGAKRSAPATALFREQRWERVVAAPDPGIGDVESWYRRGVAFAELDRCADAVPSLERAISQTTEEGVYTKFLLSWCHAQEAGRLTMSHHGFTFLASYAIRKALTKTGGKDIQHIAANNQGFLQNPHNLMERYRLALYEKPQTLKVNYSYDLPFGRGREFLGAPNGFGAHVLDGFVGGWGIADITVGTQRDPGPDAESGWRRHAPGAAIRWPTATIKRATKSWSGASTSTDPSSAPI